MPGVYLHAVTEEPPLVKKRIAESCSRKAKMPMRNPLKALVRSLVDARATELIQSHILTLDPADKHILIIPESLDFEVVRNAVDQLRDYNVLLVQSDDVRLLRLTQQERK